VILYYTKFSIQSQEKIGLAGVLDKIYPFDYIVINNKKEYIYANL
jgi:hypothetical protein